MLAEVLFNDTNYFYNLKLFFREKVKKYQFDVSQEAPFGFFAPGWWLEGPCLMCSRSCIPSCCLPPWRKGDRCPPKRTAGWSFGRREKVHSVLLEDQTWTPSLSSKIATCPRDPWNFAGSLQEGESPSGPQPEASSQALKLKVRPRTCFSEHNALEVGQTTWDLDEGFPKLSPAWKVFDSKPTGGFLINHDFYGIPEI